MIVGSRIAGSSVVVGVCDVGVVTTPSESGQVTFTLCCRSKLNVDVACSPNRPMNSVSEAVSSGQLRFTTGACDGYVVGATHIPGAYEDFVRQVVPELQRRGIFRKEYTGANLRENLGVPRPEVGAWRKAAAR